MKGKRQRRRSGFQPGHQWYPSPRNQPTSTDTEVQPGPSTAPDFQPQPSTATDDRRESLRPRKSSLKHDDDSENLGNRILDLNSLICMMNAVLRDHQTFPADCEAIHLKLHSERKVGLGSDLQFSCTSCNFISQICQTYRPSRGKVKGAAINMLLASALQDTSIGVEKANLLLASMDIPPPSRSHLQNLVSDVSRKTVLLNERDMAEKRQLVIQTNQAKGEADPRQISVSFDVRYNASRMTSSYKPGQSASQAYGVAIENDTRTKYVVGLAIENKLCWTGAHLKNKGLDVTCPGGHADCTADVDYMQPLSERRMAYNIAEKLYEEDDILIRTVTTDGDARSHLGMQDFYNKLDQAWQVTRQADPTHLGSTQVRRVRRVKWSEGMFPTQKTRASKQQALAAFSKDIKSRCSLIIAKLRALGHGDITKELNRLPVVRAATVECYAGNCHFCPHASLVCPGLLGSTGNWWYQSQFLQTHDINRLQLTANDRELLTDILQVRLSEAAVYSVSSNTSTQKCEAFNRGALASLPKEVNHARNFSGRLASKTLQLNNTLESAVEAKVCQIKGHKLSPLPAKYLKNRSQQAENRKNLQKTAGFKQKRRATRAALENRYHIARMSAATDQAVDEYSKGQMD